MSGTALVLGSGGQDGRILSAQLLAQGMRVVGVDLSTAPTHEGVEQQCVDLCDRDSMSRLMAQTQPTELYYLAAFHHASEKRDNVDVGPLFRQSFAVNVDGLLCTLEAARAQSPNSRLFYASSSHVFGRPETSPQNERTELRPESPYAVSKCAGMNVCRVMRRHQRYFAVSGVLYNHESQLRARHFVSAKIAWAAASAARAVADGRQPELLELGSLDSLVDWSDAADVTRGMQAMLRAKTPADYVIGSGVLHSVRDFCRIAFDEVGLSWEALVRQTSASEEAKNLAQTPAVLLADSAKLRYETGWKPQVPFEELVRRLVRENMS